MEVPTEHTLDEDDTRGGTPSQQNQSTGTEELESSRTTSVTTEHSPLRDSEDVNNATYQEQQSIHEETIEGGSHTSHSNNITTTQCNGETSVGEEAVNTYDGV